MAAKVGSSATQGPHQVAQNIYDNRCPGRRPGLSGLPDSSVNFRSGAGRHDLVDRRGGIRQIIGGLRTRRIAPLRAQG